MGILAVLLLLGAGAAGLVGLGVEEDVQTSGSDGGDGFSGTDQADQFAAGGGNDLLSGNGGDDTLSGGTGNDWILGFDGDDVLNGDAGDDVLVGGAGSDQINAGDGNDFVETSNLLDEALLQQSAADARAISDVDFTYDLTLSPDTGDQVDLGAGDDTVVAGSDDTLTGGAGHDEFALGDWIEGGRPVDITDFDAAEDVISFVYSDQGQAPDLTLERDDQTGVTTVRADGEAVAVVRNTSPDFSLSNVVVGRYAA